MSYCIRLGYETAALGYSVSNDGALNDSFVNILKDRSVPKEGGKK